MVSHFGSITEVYERGDGVKMRYRLDGVEMKMESWKVEVQRW